MCSQHFTGSSVIGAMEKMFYALEFSCPGRITPHFLSNDMSHVTAIMQGSAKFFCKGPNCVLGFAISTQLQTLLL